MPFGLKFSYAKLTFLTETHSTQPQETDVLKCRRISQSVLFYLVFFGWGFVWQHLRRNGETSAAFPRPSFLLENLLGISFTHIFTYTHIELEGSALSSQVGGKLASWHEKCLLIDNQAEQCLFNKRNSCIYISFIPFAGLTQAVFCFTKSSQTASCFYEAVDKAFLLYIYIYIWYVG